MGIPEIDNAHLHYHCVADVAAAAVGAVALGGTSWPSRQTIVVVVLVVLVVVVVLVVFGMC